MELFLTDVACTRVFALAAAPRRTWPCPDPRVRPLALAPSGLRPWVDRNQFRMPLGPVILHGTTFVSPSILGLDLHEQESQEEDDCHEEQHEEDEA